MPNSDPKLPKPTDEKPVEKTAQQKVDAAETNWDNQEGGDFRYSDWAAI